MAAASELLGSLAEAERAFAAGDAISASALLDGAVAACAALTAAGVRLDPATLERAHAAQQACVTAALATAEELAAELGAAGTARRAAHAYGR
jgi:hypothetical protein